MLFFYNLLKLFQSKFFNTAFYCFFALTFFSSISLSAQECNIIYVTPNGSSSGTAGTKAAPASLTYALTLANTSNNKILMASGTYNISSPIQMKSNLTIEGGYNAATWEKSNLANTTIYRDNSNIESNPSRLVGIYCNNISNFRFQDLLIRTANAFGGGTSVYTLYLNGCSNYEIVRCKILSGNAGNGSVGNNGNSGTAGESGIAGEDGANDDAGPRAGGAGGSGSFTGSFAGGKGGDGGERGTADCAFCGDPQHGINGYPGENGQASPPAGGGGYGGMGGQKIVVCTYPSTPPRTTLNDGVPGTDGSNGLAGTDGSDGVASFAGGFYIPGNGGTGTDGTHGQGGGGGGGGGSLGGIPYDCAFGLPPNWNGTGAGGGGGGEGGKAGTGGTGGTGGGSSFALFVTNNGANGIIKDSKLTYGVAGTGGLGGNGGTGGIGGAGGLGGGKSNTHVGAGGDGGDGGIGGRGGSGGKGSDGIALDLYEDEAATNAVNLQNVYSLQQPLVFIQSSGCTNAPVTFSTTANGTVIWFYGAGASPASGNGLSSTTKFTTTGRKTFTMVNNGISYTYTDFFEVTGTGSNMLPVINSTDSALCIADSGTYACSTTADSYTWRIVKDSTLDTTISGPAFQTLNFHFDSAGEYSIYLKSVDECCGPSFPDTFLVKVGGLTQPSITIQSEDAANIVCDSGSFTFSATVTDAGLNPTYQWFVNGSPSGGSYPIFTAPSLQNSDSVNCVVTSSLGCSTGLKDTSGFISVTVIELPQVTCSADSFFSGSPTSFYASVTSGGMPPFDFNWSFGDTSLGFGDTVSHIYQKAGTYNYQVNVTDSNGCAGSCNGTVVIETTLRASFTASLTSGCAPLSVEFTNNSVYAITYLWDFGDGTSSVSESPTHQYNNPGTYTVTMMAFGASGTDTSSVSNQVYVYPQPVANFQAITAATGDTVYFADNSVSAWSWFWNFGDGETDTVQNPVHLYEVNGTYDVMLVVSNGYGCSDTTFKPGFITINVGEEELLSGMIKSHIFPNPFTNGFYLSLDSQEQGSMKLAIKNILGQTVFLEERIFVPGKIIFVPFSPSGIISETQSSIFLLEIDFNGERQYSKLIYQR